jgi:hypothetical protein
MLKIILLLTTVSVRLAPAQIVSEALWSFPARTLLIEYDNLAELRNLSNYELLRHRLAVKPLEDAKAALAKLDIPESQVDELVLGMAQDSIYGLVTGSFSASLAAKTAASKRLLPLPVEDSQVLCPGTSVCLTFVEEDVAAFGTLSALRTMLLTRLGLSAALNSDTELAELMGKTSARAAVRGLALGSGIQSVVTSASEDTTGLKIEWSALNSLVSLFSYSIEIDREAHVTSTLACKSTAAAFLLRQLLGTAAAMPPSVSPFQHMQVSSDGTSIIVTMDTPRLARKPSPRSDASDASLALREFKAGPDRKRRRGSATVFQIPVSPGTRVEDARRCVVDHFREVLGTDQSFECAQVVHGPISHHVREKMDRVGERFGGT